MKRNMGGIKSFGYITLGAIVLLQCSIATRKNEIEGDLKLNLVADKVKEKAQKDCVKSHIMCCKLKTCKTEEQKKNCMKPLCTELECSGDLVYSDCHSACEPRIHCYATTRPSCPSVCRQGCGCPEGFIRSSQNSTTCIDECACHMPPSGCHLVHEDPKECEIVDCTNDKAAGLCPKTCSAKNQPRNLPKESKICKFADCSKPKSSQLCPVTCVAGTEGSTEGPNEKVLKGIPKNKEHQEWNTRNKDEVILGPHAEWEKDKKKIPVTLTVYEKEQKVKKTKSWYFANGFDLTQNQWGDNQCHKPSKSCANWIKVPAQLKYSDKSSEAVTVEVCCDGPQVV